LNEIDFEYKKEILIDTFSGMPWSYRVSDEGDSVRIVNPTGRALMSHNIKLGPPINMDVRH
jgi:hypothetical protein